MPFWQMVQRCANCIHWHADDPSAVLGECRLTRPARSPFWMTDDFEPRPHATRWDEGNPCGGYAHGGKRLPHPLDDAPATLSGLQSGDEIGMRTYHPGDGVERISRDTARVLRVTPTLVVLQFLGKEYRMRRWATERLRGGTLMEMDGWGIDMAFPVQRATRPPEQMDTAVARLANVVKGDKLQLLGYPPFDGQTKVAYVLAVTATDVLIRSGHGPKLRLYRTGPLAGMIANDPCWLLDTRA